LDSSLNYNYKIVRQFAIATVVWGVVGMLAGVWIAAQLAWPALNFDIPCLTYSRLRPLHTNAVISAFGICGLFVTSYYVVQRTCQLRLFSDRLAAFTFWGWQAVLEHTHWQAVAEGNLHDWRLGKGWSWPRQAALAIAADELPK
jgi:cytochrome c oxidase cbb3-type subunit 1